MASWLLLKVMKKIVNWKDHEKTWQVRDIINDIVTNVDLTKEEAQYLVNKHGKRYKIENTKLL